MRGQIPRARRQPNRRRFRAVALTSSRRPPRYYPETLGKYHDGRSWTRAELAALKGHIIGALDVLPVIGSTAPGLRVPRDIV